jgi:rod shape-determining protein MreD
MKTDVLKQIGWFLVFVLAQVLVLGQVHVFQCATPLLYVYFITPLPCNYPKWATLLWGFALGLTVDVFSNTPGVAAGAMTLIAAVQPYYAQLFIPRDAVEGARPTLALLGGLRFFYYTGVLVLLYCLLFFTLEMFSFFNWLHWLQCVVGSTVITLALIYSFELAKKR